MSEPVVRLPVRIVRQAESIRLDDRDRTGIAYIYFSERSDHARATGRLMRAEAEALAKHIARLLTEAGE